MKRFLIITLILISAVMAGADYYNAQHWLIGSLEAGAADSAQNKTVYGYFPESSEAYSTDVSGTAGKSGLSSRYMINAFEIPNRVYAPGDVLSVEVRGANPAGPAGLTGSAKGYDVVPDLVLRKALDLTISVIRESGINLRKGDYIPEDPKLSLKLHDPSVRPFINRSLIELKDPGSHGVIRTIPADSFLDEYRFSSALEEGTYDLTASVWDPYGNSGSLTVQDLKVSKEKRALELITDRTVWRPARGEELTLAYILTRDMDVDINGINIAGEYVKSLHFASGTMGGRAGYNAVKIDGRVNGGGMIGNGIFIMQMTSGRDWLGRIKIVVAN